MQDNRTIFESSEFCNGFVEFCDSAEYQKYMKPFLSESIEVCRTKLETTDEHVKYQSRLSALRLIDNMANRIKFEKQIKADEAKEKFPAVG